MQGRPCIMLPARSNSPQTSWWICTPSSARLHHRADCLFSQHPKQPLTALRRACEEVVRIAQGGENAVNERAPDQGGHSRSSLHREYPGLLPHRPCGCYQEEKGTTPGTH